MNDFHLIFFLDNQNLDIDNKIGFLSVTVPKLLDIWLFLRSCYFMLIREIMKTVQ